MYAVRNMNKLNGTSGVTWNLVADIGGTNARLGIEDCATSRLQLVEQYTVSQHENFSDILSAFLTGIASAQTWKPQPEGACFAVACAVESDCLHLTNSSWTIDRAEVSAMLGGISVELINDFAAVGYAVTDLNAEDWHEVGRGQPVPGRPIAILGPGTGLGVCSLLPVGAGYSVIEGEGGHVDFAPASSQEILILKALQAEFGRVSVERLLSGSGLLNIYQALATSVNDTLRFDTPEAVSQAAQARQDGLAVEALSTFFAVLGSVAGNLALTLGAKGGVYIAGGIAPQLIEFAEASELRERFEAKGRFRSYLENIPLRIVIKEDLGLVGSVKKLSLSQF